MPPSNRTDLRRPRKEEAIIRDILEQVRTGALATGDRLASIKDLCTTYGVSQRIVDSAIGELVNAGIVVTRHRRGCFITPNAMQRVQSYQAEDTQRGLPTAPAESRILADYLLPRAEKATLTIFLSELFPSCLNLWNDVLEDFAEAHGSPPIEVLSCLDGHVEEILESQHVDVIQTTPLMLGSLGRERFVPLASLDMVDIDHADLLPPVRQRVEHGAPLYGAPFQMTLTYLFVNLDLVEAAGLDSFAPRSIADWLAVATQAEAPLRRQGAAALHLSVMFDWLVMTGALTLDDAGNTMINDAEALAFFGSLVGTPLRPEGSLTTLNDFVDGKLMSMRHCSYEVIELMSKASFRWQALPLPLAPGMVSPSWLTVLAVNRNSTQPQTCMELVRYLSSPAIQHRFGVLHGNLPVLSAAAFSPEASRQHPIPARVIQAEIDQSTMMWSEPRWSELLRHLELSKEIPALIAGDMSPQQVLDRLKVYCSFTKS